MQTVNPHYQLVSQPDTRYQLFVLYEFGGWVYRLDFESLPSQCVRYAQTPASERIVAVTKGNLVAASMLKAGAGGSRRAFC